MIKLFFFISTILTICPLISAIKQSKNIKYIEYQLIWSDEFNKMGLPDTTKWNYDIGGSGWGNKELQFYCNRRIENTRIENGHLIIEAHKEKFNGKDYTSARLTTIKTGEWRYGRMEIKAKLPRGRGTWPAIWMLPAKQQYGQWPASGEIDIMEHVGFDPGKVHGAVHTKKFNHMINTQKTEQIIVKDALETFHQYAIEWTPEFIDFFIDEKKYFTFKNDNSGWESWPFDQSFYLVLNIAIGGNWGGQMGVDDTIFPKKMEIDYVRIYEKK